MAKAWQWIAGGLGAALVGVGIAKREEIVGYLKFDKNNVLPDSIMRPYLEFDISAIFEKYGSYLRRIQVTGIPLSAYIKQECAKQGTNPAWIIVGLQREQSLIEMTDAEAADLAVKPKTWTETDGQHNGSVLDYRLRWALGFAAFDNGVKQSSYAGIGNQCQWVSGWAVRKWAMAQAQIGKTMVLVSGGPVVPANAATVLQYEYTPHESAALTNFTLARRYFPNLMSA